MGPFIDANLLGDLMVLLCINNNQHMVIKYIALDKLIDKLDDRWTRKTPAKIVKPVGEPVFHPTPTGLSKWIIDPSNDTSCKHLYVIYGMIIRSSICLQ